MSVPVADGASASRPSAADVEEELRALHRSFDRLEQPSVGRALVAAHVQHAESLAGSSPARTGLSERNAPAPMAGIPEVAPADLDVDLLERALVDHGAVIVRGLIPEEHCTRIIDSIDRGLEGQIEFVTGNGELHDPTRFQPYPVPAELAYIRNWAIQNSALMLLDSPALFYDVLRMLRDTGIVDLARAYLEAEPVMTMTKSAGRRIEEGTGICWHQDGAFLGTDNIVLNLWTALTPCGPGRAPGLELVARRFQEIVPPRDDSPFDWAVGESLPDGVDWVTYDPVLDAGDALLFDHMLLHRTATGRGTTKARYGTETWFFGAGSVPAHEFGPVSSYTGAGDP